MIELDDKLGGTAVQHQEVQGRESTAFLSYFPNKTVTYLEGGVSSGYATAAEPTLSEPHLFHIKGTKKANTLRLTQQPNLKLRRDNLNAGDVFVLTAGESNVWVWTGKEANADEKTKGKEVAQSFCKKGTVVVLEQGVNDGEKQAASFWAYLPGKVAVLGPIKRSVSVQDSDNKDDRGKSFIPILYRLPDEIIGGKLHKVAKAKATPVGPTRDIQMLLPRSALETNHGYLLDTGFMSTFGWEASQAMRGAWQFLSFTSTLSTTNVPYFPLPF